MLNRAVGRRTIFESAADYAGFIDVVAEAIRTRPMRICGYCVMPNHWHMVLWPEHDAYFHTVIRYVERNPLRANLAARAEDWPWSSLGQTSAADPIPLAPWPVPQPSQRHGEKWIEWVNEPQTERELHSLRLDLVAGTFFFGKPMAAFSHDQGVRSVPHTVRSVSP